MASLVTSEGETNELLYLGLNQDASCFAAGTTDGFRIYNCDPFKETFRRDFNSGGVGMVEMLFRCNILALVGGGANPRWPKHKVMLWDDHQNRCIGELSFRSEVRAVRLRRDRVVVVLKTRVYVYNFADLTLADHLETVDNPRGLCAVCPSPTNNVLACPGASKGSVRIELYDAKVRRTVAAHEGALARLALNASGTRLATASETGTLIRVWDTATGDLLQELRRGSEKADICCIAFNSTSTLLACASDKGTVHIFKLAGNVADAPDAGGSGAASTMSGAAAGSEANAQSLSTAALSAGGTIRGGDASGVRSNASGAAAGAPAEGEGSSSLLMRGVQRMLPKYFSSEWSFAQFRVPATLSICAFSSEPNIIMVIGADGTFHKANFEKGGEAVRVAVSFLDGIKK